MNESAMDTKIVRLQTNLIAEGQLHPTRLALGCLEDLTQSVRHLGVMTPLTVCQREGRYDLIDGFRRYQVAKDLGIKSVVCVVYEDLNDAEILKLSYTLNTQQNPLNPIEEALVFQRLKDEHGYSHDELVILGCGSKGHISKAIGLLELPTETQNQVASGELTKSVAFELKKLKDPERIKNAAKLAIANEWSQRRARCAVEQMNRKARSKDKNDYDERVTDQEVPDVYFKDAKNMSELPENSIGAIVTSPPYNVEKDYEKGLSFSEHLENIGQVMAECARVLVPGGTMCINVTDILNFKGAEGNNSFSQIQPMAHIYQKMLRKHGVYLRDQLVWVKDRKAYSDNPALNYSENIKHADYRIIARHEPVLIFRKKGERPTPSEDIVLKSRLTREEWKMYAPSIWEINHVRNAEDHPARFPEELVSRLIKMYSYVGETVLDPFLGSGTTIKVARALGRDGVGYERDLRYKATIMKKLGVAEETKHESVKEYVDRQLEEIEANQPEEPKVEVIMSEGMAKAVEEILPRYQQERKRA